MKSNLRVTTSWATMGPVMLSGAVLGGCVGTNSRTTVGDYLQPTIFSAHELSDVEPVLTGDAPSTPSLSRSNWKPMALEAPVDAVGYRPLYATPTPRNEQTARQRLEYPTPISATEGARVGYWDQMGEAGMAFVYGLEDFVLIVPRMCMTQPWDGPQRLTPQPYWRGPVWEAREATWGRGTAAEPKLDAVIENLGAPTPAKTMESK